MAPLGLQAGAVPETTKVLNPAQADVKGREDRVLEVYGDTFKLAHVECDDQGGFWETGIDTTGDSPSGLKRGRNQIDFLEAVVENDLVKRRSLYRNGAIILTFVHGWNNNAAEANGNLKSFREVAYRVWQDEHQPQGMKRPVIAVYVSWRGRVLRNATSLGIDGVPVAGFIADIPHYLSFANRKATAEKLGYRAAAETLKRLSLLRKKIEEVEPVPSAAKNSRAIIVGHSFGAAAVFSSVSRFYEDELMELAMDSRRRKKEPWIHRQWDLVVLINPAFEALRYATIARYSRDKRIQDLTATQQQPFLLLPRMLVVGADNDVPNRTLFPIGQRAANLTSSVQKGERLDQKARLFTSLGSYADFATHRLVAHPECTGCPARLEALPPAKGSPTIASLSPLRAGMQSSPWAQTFEDLGVVDKGSSIGPFMLAQAEPKVIDGHNGIWNENFRGFLRSLIRAREAAVQKAQASRHD